MPAFGYSRSSASRSSTIRLAHRHPADAARCGRDEQAAHWRLDRREPDCDAGAAAPIRRRRHAQLRNGPLVEAAARSEAGVQGGIGHRLAPAQPVLDPLQPARLRILPRRDADDPFEIPLQMIGAPSETPRERRERQVPVDVRQVDARAADPIDPRIGSDDVARTASAARPEPGALCLVGRLEEGDAIPARPPARTAGAAVDAGRPNRVDEGPGCGAIARDDGVPACGVDGLKGGLMHTRTMRRTRRSPLSGACGAN